jgi:elongation factor Ts
MATITAAQVRDLREETGLPMMECKAALEEAGGDKEAAIELLKKKYKGKMEQRADRETGEGRVGIFISDDGKSGGIIELRCETAPVGKNDLFIELATRIAKAVTLQDAAAPDAVAVKALKSDTGRTIEEEITEVFGRLREAMNIGLCRKVAGEYVASYVHHDGKSGVMVSLNAKPSDDAVAKDLCQHAIFTKPIAISPDGVSKDLLAKVRQESGEIAKSEGKPDHIIDKIVDGKVAAFLKETVLVEQEHVKPEYDKKSVGDVLRGAGVTEVQDLAIVVIGSNA